LGWLFHLQNYLLFSTQTGRNIFMSSSGVSSVFALKFTAETKAFRTAGISVLTVHSTYTTRSKQLVYFLSLNVRAYNKGAGNAVTPQVRLYAKLLLLTT
jgi:hypothetical protein